MALPIGDGYANGLEWSILFDHGMLSISAVPEVAGADTFYLNNLQYSTFYIDDATTQQGRLLFRTYNSYGNPATRFITIGW